MWHTLQRLTGLRTLSLSFQEEHHFDRHQSLNIGPVSTLTQLHTLELSGLMDTSFSCAVLATLVGLTKLELKWATNQQNGSSNSSDVEQQQQRQQQQRQQQQEVHQQEMRRQGQGLQLAISHMRHLKELSFHNILVPPGIAGALAQLTGLTGLRMDSIRPEDSWNSGACQVPCVLPSVEYLFLYGQGALQFLTLTHLPQLACMHLDMQPGQVIAQARLLHDHARVLQLCLVFALKGAGKEVAVDELASSLATLASIWQQPPPAEPREVTLEALCCPRAALSHLPLGMTCLSFE
jgi:hypothetical protein